MENKEKLVITFMSGGYRPLVAFVFENENLHSDLHAQLEKILKEQIIPNEWFGLVYHMDDFSDDEDFEDYVAIDLGYYISLDEVEANELDDEKINRWYIENNVQVVYMEEN